MRATARQQFGHLLLATVLSAGAAFGENVPAPGAPGEDVMRPTQHGLQMTPDLGRAFALAWLNRNADRVDMSPEQVKGLSQVMGDRFDKLSRENTQTLQQFFEQFIETALTTGGSGGKLTPESAQKIADRALPIVPLWHRLLDGIAEDGRSVLDDRQQKQLQEIVQRRHGKVTQIEETFQRWSRGEYSDKDQNRIDRLMSEMDEDSDPSATPVNPMVRQAERRARTDISRLGPEEWKRFLAGAKSAFKFDAEQSAKADGIYTDFKARADEIMTPQWRLKVQQNRTKINMRWSLRNQPLGPWAFHLDREYEEMRQPIDRLGRQFYREVTAVASVEQKQALLSGVAEKAAQHGLKMGAADRQVLLGIE